MKKAEELLENPIISSAQQENISQRFCAGDRYTMIDVFMSAMLTRL